MTKIFWLLAMVSSVAALALLVSGLADFQIFRIGAGLLALIAALVFAVMGRAGEGLKKAD